MVACRVVTDATAFRAVARDAPAGSRVPVEVRVDVDDPWLAYRRARREDDRWGVFLETTGEDAASTAGWNYFAVDPVETLTARRDAVALDAARAATTEPSDGSPPHRNSSTGESAVHGESSDGEPAAYGESSDGETAAYGESARGDSPSLAALEGLVDGETLVRGDCDVPYPCGAFGWLSYDVARELEALPETTRDDRELPHVEVGVYDRVAAWQTSPVDDRPTTGPDTAGTAQQTPTGHDDAGAGDATRGPASTTLRITVCPRIPADAGSATALDAIHEDAVDRARALAERARTGDPGHGPAPATDVTQATFESDAGRDAYADRVRRVQSAIRDGDTFQANVSHRLRAPAAVHPVAAYDALRRVNPAPYSGLLECPSVDLVSASPELLLECDGRRVRTEPIAGTRPRGDTPAADAALRAELTSDEKERAEHAMLVDLERNDLGKVCTYGSVDVAEYRRVDRYSEVMHLVSDVTGRLRADVGLADAIGAVFPGGTITGAPKPRTMAIIDDVEATRRGPYTGAMAALGFDDRTTLNIVIRTLTRHGEEYHLRVGAGIVHDSDPEREYDETLDKAAALLNAIDDALDADATMHVEVPDP